MRPLKAIILLFVGLFYWLVAIADRLCGASPDEAWGTFNDEVTDMKEWLFPQEA